MNPDQIVFETLSSSGIPGARTAYQKGKAPPLPWFVYLRERGGEVFADDSNHSKLQRYRAELYQREYDPDVQEAFEAAIASIGPYTSYDTWLPTEQCIETVYEFTYHNEPE